MQQAPSIDMKRTGQRIGWLCKICGYSASEIQKYLHLSCPQSVYNWFHGKTLPSLDNLYALSALLCVPINWFLVSESAEMVKNRRWMLIRVLQLRRIKIYLGWKRALAG